MHSPIPYFSTPVRVAALETAALAWLDTPYVVSGAVRGHGASCHRLVGEILCEAGFKIAPPEKGTTGLREFTETMRRWLDAHPHMARVEDVDGIMAGDILLCEIGIGHIALALSDRRVVQVLRHSPTHIVSFNDPNARSHVLAAYRPMEDNYGK